MEKKRAIEAWKKGWMDAARNDKWTQEQQIAFENALLTAPYSKSFVGSQVEAERYDRWCYIASKVEGKTMNQCLLRYKLLVQMTVDKKKANNALTAANAMSTETSSAVASTV